MHFELSPMVEWIASWIVNTYSEFQVNIFSNRDVTKCTTMTMDNDNVNAIAIPQVFSHCSKCPL